jgi:alpha-ketoglutarate-dependent taurine dioxygenase
MKSKDDYLTEQKEKFVFSGLQSLSTEEIQILKRDGFIKGSISTKCQNTASLWLIEQMNLLGRCISYYDQPQVMSIRPTQGFGRYSSGGDFRLVPHTDLAWFEKPPKYIGMFCIHPGGENEYQTISDSLEVLKVIPQNVLDQLRITPIHFPAPEHVDSLGFTGRIIENEHIRINSRNIRETWSESAEIFLQELIHVEKKIKCKTGDYWFVDNERYCHGRCELQPNTLRHLLRVYAQSYSCQP